MNDEKSKLINKFCPIFHFDSRESHFPIDMNTYQRGVYSMKNCVNVYLRDQGDHYWIYYYTFYEYDAGMCCCHFDAHELDIELIILEVNVLTETLNRVCFCPHSSKEHFWLSKDDTQKLIGLYDHRIHVYASKWKHACYPVAGRIWRYFGFANDKNNNAIVRNPRPIFLTIHTIESEIFENKKNQLEYDFNQVPEIPLDRVKYHMFFKLPF